MKRYERATTTFFAVGFDMRPANPSPPDGDDSWSLVCVVRPRPFEVVSTAYWQREVEVK